MTFDTGGVPHLPAWWGVLGRTSYVEESDLGSGAPWTFAGHAVGAWQLDEPYRAPRSLTFPGQMTLGTNLAIYDSAAVAVSEGGSWYGFGGSLARATGYPKNHRVPGAGGAIAFRNGDFEFDEDAVLIERADEKTWLRVEVMGSRRGMYNGYDESGRHMWGVAGGYQGGRNRVHGGFSQRASASALTGTEEQSSDGESGFLGYERRFGDFDVSLELSRNHDTHESFGSFFIEPRPEFGLALAPSSRDAQGEGFRGELSGRLGGQRVGARFEARHASVIRSGDGAFVNQASWQWGAVRYERAAGDGVLRVDLGVGKHSAWDRIEVAPSMSYRAGGAKLQGRVAIERTVLPVWTDLADGQVPFMQRTWAGVIGARGSLSPRLNGWGTALFGRTQNRAVIKRFPLEEMWLRAGLRADSKRYDFGLFWAGGAWTPGSFSFGGEGFVLVREQSPAQPLVDPAKGFRSHAAWTVRLFKNDLGLTFRLGADGMGTRDSEGLTTRVLPGYVSYRAELLVTLADAVITIHALNLEDKMRPRVWMDSDTGAEALGPGREVRLTLTLRLTD